MENVIRSVDYRTVLPLAFMLVILFGIFAAMLGGVVNSIANYIRKTRLDEMEATLKMEMIQRGMSAEEISEVLAARMDSNKTAWHHFWDGCGRASRLASRHRDEQKA